MDGVGPRPPDEDAAGHVVPGYAAQILHEDAGDPEMVKSIKLISM